MGKTTPEVPFFNDSGRCSKILDYTLGAFNIAQNTMTLSRTLNMPYMINQDFILVTLDVRALYTNILNHEGIEAVKETLNNQSSKVIGTRVIFKFLYLMLSLLATISQNGQMHSNNFADELFECV